MMPEGAGHDFMALWDYRNPAASEAAFRGLLPQAEAGSDPTFHAELLTQIARAQGLQREFDDAHRTLEGVEAILGAALPRATVRWLLERGRVFNSSGKADAARPLFIQAWEVARREGLDGLAVDAAHMVAIVERPDEALRWNKTALELANTSSDPDARRWKGSLCNNIGWTYHDRGEFEKALEYFQQALAHRRDQGKAEDIRVARWCVARCFRSLGRITEALAIQRKLENETVGIDPPDGFVDEEIAECLLALGHEDESRPYFRRAYEILSRDPWLMELAAARVQRLGALGRVGP